MTRRIYKYPASTHNPGGVTLVTVQKGAKLICGKLQNDWPTFWFMVDPDIEVTQTWAVTVVFTGQDMPEGMEDAMYMGTEIGADGLVWHFFAKKLNDLP